MVKQTAATLDRVFHALSDSTRRDILSRVSSGPVSVTSLAQGYRMSLPAVVKHLSVLESCGLIKTDKVGRVRKCELEAGPLKVADEWLEEYRTFWEAQLDSLGSYLDTIQAEENNG